ncbi:arsenic-transporting ATPase [Frankia sp. CcI156]|uniref:Arsenite efflux ATP-binding protein ArsA n=1 Tax=Frankia casuarinae (strain DSM 45818 / CECT 9043 / HFP020203 / CcI3) TaxID=106370 RepID=Q2J8E1_FRACC|nr:arsenite efflux ATP-binding protein ArsA [Frankia casuarinae]ETA01464.1 arsenite efflux ATP-binding protein ArsA [Frankia sp. CcI6]KDA44727.1 arsenite efflux ATP-binding protein ArsA [Frankia sp. BMG5.23]OFB45093.1 arsenic-transporting ATPase [Frankia sp. CgIM4]OHV53110.1 arsenic-transporting ATPase [Frankia sp. CgIS1]ONH24576.1 arsenic-transporting ATPase [Frankia sp. CcI156]ORT54234.1 arsenic-transporting ATPase [Frankia sp. KB5]TFE33470.1 ArsA family ATPase [Frankia sp. B2]
MRCVLFTGKGGGGTTTVAAATAILAAQRGHRTLVLSVDPAAGLAGALDHPIGAEPTELEPGLHGQQVDLRRAVETRWPAVREVLAGTWPAINVDPFDLEELAFLPGAVETLTLLELRDGLTSENYDLVVVDGGPAAALVRLLAFPETLSWYCRRLLPPDGAFARWLRPGFGWAAALGGRWSALAAPAYDTVSRLHRAAVDLRAILTDHATTSVRLVATPESSALAAARGSFTALSLHGFTLDGVVVNRIFPPANADAWRAGWAAVHREQLADITAAFMPTPVLPVGYRAGEPIGLEELAAFGAATYGELDPGSVLGEPLIGPSGQPRVERTEDGFALSFGLPFVDSSQIDLARLGDDLVVTVGSYRRAVPLPAALRRCDVSTARLRDDRLVVSFVPDPRQWVRV